MYNVGNGIKSGKRLAENASCVFENNTKDLNFIYFMINDFRKKHPDYISKLENFYQMSILQILKKFIDSKTDLKKIERDFAQMLDSINKFSRDRSLTLSKINPNIMPNLKPEVNELLKTGSLEDKIQFLLDYITKREKSNNDSMSETIKLWDNISRKKFQDDINDLREKSIGFIKKGFLSVSTKEINPEPSADD